MQFTHGLNIKCENSLEWMPLIEIAPLVARILQGLVDPCPAWEATIWLIFICFILSISSILIECTILNSAVRQELNNSVILTMLFKFDIALKFGEYQFKKILKFKMFCPNIFHFIALTHYFQ
jgi:hypothetical protein